MDGFAAFLVIAGGTILAALLLGIEHLLCGPADARGLERIGVVERYTIGTLALVACQVGTLALLGASLLLIVALVVVAFGAGAVLWGIYLWRRWQQEHDALVAAKERAAGPLSQVTIDRVERKR